MRQAPVAPSEVRDRLASVVESAGATPHAPRAFHAPARLRAVAARLIGQAGIQRLVPLGICGLLVVATLVSSLPAVALASVTAKPRASSQLGADIPYARFGQADEPAAPDSNDLYLGDGSIPNTLHDTGVATDARTLMQTYIVQAGDTLGSIADRSGLAVATIYWANKSVLPDPQLLRPGQVLVIPPIDGLIIVVANNDTLESIAAKYGVTSDDIVFANDLYDPTLVVGQTVIIPGAETPPVPTPNGSKSDASGSTGWTGGLLWPVPGHTQITQPFGCTGVISEAPYGNCRHFHGAIDIGAPQGSSVVAVAAGTVIYAGWKLAGSDGYGGGLVVWISHGGTLYTTYSHLSSEFVAVGQNVRAGQRIGSVGMTGAATGPHLDFEVWVCYPWTGGTVGCTRNPLSYTR